MLVAKTDDGRLVSLLSPNYSRPALIALKTKKRFFCPVCGRPVVLKMGTKRKWHFAHDPDHPCLLESEPESAGHLSGKEDLFVWLERHGLRPKLECYLPEIKQRPDLFLPGRSAPIAFEYQCSAIADDIWLKRTAGYIRAGIKPLWLIGSRRQRKKGFTCRLAGFEPLAIRSSVLSMSFFPHPFASPYYLTYYDPETRQFHFFHQLHPAGETAFIFQAASRSIDHLSPHDLINPSFSFSSEMFKEHWLAWKKNKRLSAGRRASRAELDMRRLCYAHRFVFTEFPSFVGLPHHHFIHLSGPPHLWQLFIYLLFYLKYPDSWIRLQTLVADCRSKAAGRLFRFRPMPLCKQPSLRAILQTYLYQLSALNVIERRGEYYRMPLSPAMPAAPIAALLAEDRTTLNRLEKRLTGQT